MYISDEMTRDERRARETTRWREMAYSSSSGSINVAMEMLHALNVHMHSEHVHLTTSKLLRILARIQREISSSNSNANTRPVISFTAVTTIYLRGVFRDGGSKARTAEELLPAGVIGAFSPPAMGLGERCKS